MPIDSKKRQLMIEAYHKASEKQKATLHLMALGYFPLEEATLKVCLEKISSFFEKDKDLFKNAKDIDVRQLLQSLKNKILFPSSSSYSSYSDEIPRSLVHFLTLEALKSPHEAQLMKALQEVSHSYFGKEDFETKGHVTERFFKKYYTASDQFKHKKLFDLRLALYQGEEKPFLALAQSFPSENLQSFFGALFLEESLDIGWLKTRPIMAQHIIFYIKLFIFVLKGGLVEEVSSLLAHYLPLRDTKGYEGFNDTLLAYDIWSGNLEKAEENLKQDGNPESFSFQALLGMITFLKGQNEEAIALFDTAHKMMRKVLGRRNVLFGPHETLCYILALFKSDDKQQHKKIQTLLGLENSDRSREVSRALGNILKKLQGHDDKIDDPYPYDKDMDPFVGAIVALADFWLEEDYKIRVNLPSVKRQFETYKNLLPLVAKIFAEILQKHELKNQQVTTFLEKFKDLPSFLSCIHIQEVWQRKLATLDHVLTTLSPSPKSPKATKTSKQLLWLFDPKTRELTPMEQGVTRKTTKGRPIALKRLFEASSQLDYLTAEDKRVIQTLRKEKVGWNGRYINYEWDNTKTPLALVGHSAVFHAQHPDLRIDLVAASPELIVKKVDRDQFHISLSLISFGQKVVIAQETPTLYRVIEFPKSWVPLAEILGSEGLKVPSAAKDHVLSLLQKAGPVLPIQSEVGTLDIPSQAGDSTPCFHFTPLEQGLKVSLFVRPFEDKGPYFRPSQGNASLSLVLDGKPLRANRALNEEKQKSEAVIKACSRLNLTQDGSDTWIFEDPQDCLEALEELQNAQGTHPLKLEWPEGQKLTLTKPISFDQLSLNIHEKGEWFHLKGEIKIDENTVIDFQRLLQLLDQSPTRFIPLDNKTYISLTTHLKKQLQELKAFTEQTADGSKIHGFGSFALKNLTDKVSCIEGDKGWKDKLKLFKEADNFQPVLSSTLQADLRDYQKEGFGWLSRLSALGLGACLADDMGLGKTLQALAVMLNHAPKAPCLVVAPTSVCHNWMSEIEKFAPTLKTYSLNQYSTSSKRKELIESLNPLDVLICSYSLLQQEETHLAEKPWQMIVLDEAQAIKNTTTKRFQAAIRLKGTFKLALTGTPIENHGEEIWSLFRFIAPGLLGSLESFRKRFLEDTSKKASLKSLINMFILRRTKSVVLQELPSRIDQTLLIDMEPEEFAFYEALRRDALKKVSSFDNTNTGQRKLHILAELTKLRQACCHPQLAKKEISLPSSKLKAFSHLVDDLLENNHQALVFSQYVSYLNLVRETLDNKNIPYQYLNGSTPAEMRKRQVQAFQEGQSPLFFLSLKAGGSGLNLTAADYVIHLDPWWNPAVEDQASDRAHRLGQTRPVTIYRLIMKNTIEERILELHKAKRDLAEKLLDDTHVTSKLSEEELLKLMGDFGSTPSSQDKTKLQKKVA